MTVMHPACGSTWKGSRSQHCAGCCATFSSTATGDHHRAGSYERRRCVPEYLLPAIGLVRRADGVWSTSEYMRPGPPRREA